MLPVTFSGSDFRASEPGAPFDQSGTTGRSFAPNAKDVIYTVRRMKRQGRFMGRGEAETGNRRPDTDTDTETESGTM